MASDGAMLLASWLEPLGVGEFFDRYWRREMLHVLRDPDERHTPLFSWERLSQVLDDFPMLPPRMSLLHGGRPIPFRDYMNVDAAHEARLRRADLCALLERGASLILKRADDLHPPLRRALGGLEKLLRMPVQANLYAAWGHDEGFPLHWDQQDTFILQIAGRKHWTIFRPTAEAPVKAMRPEPPAPGGEPVFADELQAGQCLYVPRGWWHFVQPVDEPTLHLTITCELPTGLLLLQWIAERLVERPIFRADVPLPGGRPSPDRPDEFLPALRDALAAELSDPDVLGRFWDWSESRAQPPGRLALPDLYRGRP